MKKMPTAEIPAEPKELLPKSKIPLVFISHDTRDSDIAGEFSILLRNASAGFLKSFRSSDKKGNQGLEFGSEWYPEIMQKIDDATDVVCLLTQNSTDRPWILYEAGVAKGKLGTKVLGIALGIPLTAAIKGPFAQFQNCDDDPESLTKLVSELVKRVPGSDPDEKTIRAQVETFKNNITEIFKKSVKDNGSKDKKEQVGETSVAKLFEEVKIMFQELPSMINERVGPENRRKRNRRFHPMMIEELLHLSERPGDDTGLLILLGCLREDLPWLYEIGMETFQTIKNSSPMKAERSLRKFQKTMESLRHSHVMEEWIDTEETYILIKELPRIFDRYFHNYVSEMKRNSSKET